MNDRNPVSHLSDLNLDVDVEIHQTDLNELNDMRSEDALSITLD